jgi:hypothetical protein
MGFQVLNANDDFIKPSDPNTASECLEFENNYKVSLPICGALSIACYSYLFWMYFVIKSPVFKRHPTSKFCFINYNPIMYV